MNHKSHKFFLLAFVLSCSVFAQAQIQEFIPLNQLQTKTPKETDLKAQPVPDVGQVEKKVKDSISTPVASSNILNVIVSNGYKPGGQSRGVKVAHRAPGKFTSSGAEIWVNTTSVSREDLYPNYALSALDPTSPHLLHSLLPGRYDFSEGGSYSNGNYYGVNYFANSQFNLYYNNLFKIPTNPWPTTPQVATFLDTKKLGAIETASAADGSIYGEFYNDSRSGLEIGKADFPNKDRSTIGQAQHQYVAMGITHDNVLYGIAIDGNLYKISLQDGTDQLVGPTGVNISNGNQYYSQTGEIDPNDDTFYWLGTDIDAGDTKLYTVDLSTGAATELYDYGTGWSFHGMVIRAFDATEGAPAIATNVSTTFEEDLTDGTVNFTAPTTTTDGKALEGTLAYKVFEGDNVFAQGSCQPGEQVQADVSATNDEHKFEITTSNEQGTSPAAYIYQWVGYDAIDAPSNVKASIDRSTGKVTVTWDASTKALHDGYVGNVTYNVNRSRNGQGAVVATGVSGTTYTETIPRDDISKFEYHIVAVNGNQTSADAVSNAFVWGKSFDVPYVETFQDPDHFNQFTVIDANNDGTTWEYVDLSGTRSYVHVETDGHAGDDWLITPPVNLKGSHQYNVTVELRSQSSQMPEKYEIKAGEGYTVDDMQYTVQKSTFISNGSWSSHTSTFTPSENGEYNIGIHCMSDADGWYFSVHNIKIEEAPTTEGPDSVTNLTVTAAPKGALSATVRFDAPTKSISGLFLNGNISLDIQRDDKVLATLTDVEPGKHVEFTDNDGLTNGSHDYTVTPHNGEEVGLKNEVNNVYVGIDIPNDVTNLTLKDGGNGAISADWTPVDTIGRNGGYVDPASVVYQVWSSTLYSGYIFPTEQLTEVTGTNHADVPVDPNAGLQGMQVYTVYATSTAGKGLGTSQFILVGEPYTLPFKEGFANKAVSYYWLYSRSSGDDVTADFATESSDGDGSSYSLKSISAGQTATFESGKINVKDAVAPKLSFDVEATVDGNPLDVIIFDENGVGDTLSVSPTTTSFETQDVDLTPYAGNKYIRFYIRTTYNSAATLFLDNIRIEDTPTGIDAVQNQTENGKFDVYTIGGIRVRHDAATLDGLPKGVYIVNGKKVVK